MIRPSTLGPFVKGVIASTDPWTTPKGSVPRASNLVMTQRGAFTDCDGSAIINAFNGAPQSNRGRFLSTILFEPTGVSAYYLALAKALDMPLVAPSSLVALDGGGTGLLPAGTYFYKVTALDGVGGETTVSNEASVTIAANKKISLTWNTVPNAYGYNIYRSNSSGTETLMVAAGLPVLQTNPVLTSTTFVDNIVSPFPVYSLASWSRAFASGHGTWSFTTTAPNMVQVGQTIIVSGTGIDGSYLITNKFGGATLVRTAPSLSFTNLSGTGGTITGGGASPPIANNTQQTVLFAMPNGTIPIPYSNANIVAIFPASANSFGTVLSGGSGGSGGTGPGIQGQQNSTPSGGIVGLVSLLPQMVQFTNRIAIALGNGFQPQVYSDATGTSVNPTFTGAVASVAVTGNQILVTVDPSVIITTTNLPVGSNIILSSMTDSTYNGVYVVTSVSAGAGGSFIVISTTASGGPATGTFTVSTTPLLNTFVPAYPSWVASTAFALNSITQPLATPETYYFKATQAGVSGASEPTWTDAALLGQQISDGTIIWTNQGAIQSSAPPPPGCAHIIVYAGSLWAWDTWPTNTADGLDGPTCLRMSDVNNPYSWNPINQAFIDKDDGTEGMGLAAFTISAEGIPPEGSLVAFKNYSGYQIIGVFGSSNFAIQRIRSDMGCTAPRTIKFVPGFGITRYAHLGPANFDGVRDTLTGSEISPYLFPTNDFTDADITVADANWIAAAVADLTANPPMYALAIPIGASGGSLTRLLAFDLVLKAWAVIDLPFAISTVYQARSVTSNPITLFGGAGDGLLQRWQAGDSMWLVGGASPEPSANVLWSVQTPIVFSQSPDQKLACRRLVIRGISNGATALTITPIVDGRAKVAQTYTIPSLNDFELFSSVRMDGQRFAAILSGTGHIEIDRIVFHLSPKAVGVPRVIS